MAEHHPSYAELIRRYGSAQIRAAATVGGNIANGSPIGDTPPPLIALDAVLLLRRGDMLRELPLEEFFLDYGKQDLQAGEFVEAITIPREPGAPDRLKVYKLSKRFDQDISAVLGAFDVHVEDGKVTRRGSPSAAWPAIPKRAPHGRAALTGQPWTRETRRGGDGPGVGGFHPDERSARLDGLSARRRRQHADALLERRPGRAAPRLREVRP
jgi:xanthine dehydrogenase small subunit